MGLGYLPLGQNFTTLSGGEIQRLKLIAELLKGNSAKTAYILDEASAGLHLEDLEKLSQVLQRLVEEGHSVFIAENRVELIAQADWIVEVGPEAGSLGGEVTFSGPPKELAKTSSPTGLLLQL